MTEEQWVKTREASLHYLITKGDRNLTPLVYIPGSLGSAADFQDEIEALAPRTTVAVNPRGQGRSSAPEQGYSLTHRVTDLESVLASLELQPFYLMAFSLGVPIAISYAATNRDKVKGLILLDYPARYPERSEAWLERALPFAIQRGIPEHVVRGLQREAEAVELWDELRALERSTLLVKGGVSPAVSEEDLHRYRDTPHVRIEVFEDSGHEIHKPDYQRFLRTVKGFLTQLDGGTSHAGPNQSSRQ